MDLWLRNAQPGPSVDRADTAFQAAGAASLAGQGRSAQGENSEKPVDRAEHDRAEDDCSEDNCG
ncbi:MAG: hypothetical protein MRY63_12110 [Neomegalonema sp.]|nr:hypothetical protein [Neomegalonema sp.]